VAQKYFTKIEGQLIKLKLDKMSSTNMQQLQLTQQNLENIMMQKQQIRSQLVELESALTELNTTDKAYKIIGKIMIASSKDDLIKDLEEKKEVAEVRLKNFNSQEEKLKKNLEEFQQKVMEEMQKDKK
tara:strand:- start:61 stop:444 length:384 start_codon:yes stop_codon:yes gene_type:complete